jgi:fructoselysine 6-kinase
MCAIGDNVVDRYPEEGLLFPGGTAANVAVFSRRLGFDSAYLGIIGSDPEGELVTSALEREGVDLSHALFRDEPNSSTDVRLEQNGNRVFSNYAPPASSISISDEALAFISGSDWIHTGHSSFAEHEIPLLATLAPVSYDFSYRDMEQGQPFLSHLTYAAFSRESASLEECISLLGRVVEAGPRLAVVTRGPLGSVALADGRLHVQEATPANVVDTIGAGDAFQTSLITSLLEGASLRDAMARASKFAASVCQHRGAFGHESTLATTER